MPSHSKMRFQCRVVLLLPPIALSLMTLGTQAQSPALPADTIACRVLEAHTSQELGLTLVIFHQRDENQRTHLGALLRERSGASVQFQTRTGQWHTATVLRLKSCFGRGLLLFPAGTAAPAEKDEFLLQFPRP